MSKAVVAVTMLYLKDLNSDKFLVVNLDTLFQSKSSLNVQICRHANYTVGEKYIKLYL